MKAAAYANQELLSNSRSPAALREIVAMCTAFATPMPQTEPEQAAGLQRIIAAVGKRVRSGALRLTVAPQATVPVIRLYRASVGHGRLKLQLFPLQQDDAHPPHAHHNLLSCQVVLAGRARVREFSLLRRLEGNVLEIREEPVKMLAPGDGVYTLQRRNNIHWQEGLSPGTLLLNINWQGFFAGAGAQARSMHGRRYIDWTRARPADSPGHYLVPEIDAE